MRKLLAVILVLCSFTASADIIDVTSPFNYQTVTKDIRINFRVNATTLSGQMPSKVVLYINNQEVKTIPYHASKYFNVTNLEDGQYIINLALKGVDKKTIFITQPIKFYVRNAPLELVPMRTGDE